jgi:hypothetical protein
VSNDPNSFTRSLAIGSRRVSGFVTLPVIVMCAVVGSILGVTHPLSSVLPGEPRGELSSDLSLASIKLVDDSLLGGQQTPPAVSPVQPEPAISLSQSESPAAANAAAPSLAPAPAIVVSTGSVDRSLPSGASESAALTAPEVPQVAAPDTARPAAQNHRAARAKRLRRVIWRRVPGKQTSELELLFSPMFAK